MFTMTIHINRFFIHFRTISFCFRDRVFKLNMSDISQSHCEVRMHYVNKKNSIMHLAVKSSELKVKPLLMVAELYKATLGIYQKMTFVAAFYAFHTLYYPKREPLKLLWF